MLTRWPPSWPVGSQWVGRVWIWTAEPGQSGRDQDQGAFRG